MTTDIDKLKTVLPDTLTPKEQLDIIKKRSQIARMLNVTAQG